MGGARRARHPRARGPGLRPGHRPGGHDRVGLRHRRRLPGRLRVHGVGPRHGGGRPRHGHVRWPRPQGPGDLGSAHRRVRPRHPRHPARRQRRRRRTVPQHARGRRAPSTGSEPYLRAVGPTQFLPTTWEGSGPWPTATTTGWATRSTTTTAPWPRGQDLPGRPRPGLGGGPAPGRARLQRRGLVRRRRAVQGGRVPGGAGGHGPGRPRRPAEPLDRPARRAGHRRGRVRHPGGRGHRRAGAGLDRRRPGRRAGAGRGIGRLAVARGPDPAAAGLRDQRLRHLPDAAFACSPPTARPGTSEHERGLAIDFRCNGEPIGQHSRSNPCVVWLRAHAAAYGLYNLPSEAWHWSTSGR